MVISTHPDDLLIVHYFADAIDQECYDHAAQNQSKYRDYDDHVLRLSFAVRL